MDALKELLEVLKKHDMDIDIDSAIDTFNRPVCIFYITDSNGEVIYNSGYSQGHRMISQLEKTKKE